MIKCSETWLVLKKDLPEGLSLLVLKLREHLSSLELNHVIGRRSSYIKTQIDAFLPGAEFSSLVTAIDPTIVERVPAGHKIDYAYSHVDGGTAGIELCLNNREAIGTNFSKLASYLNRREEFSSHRLSIVITLSRELLNHGGWDKSYGDSVEYNEAFDLIYGEFSSGNVVNLTLYLDNQSGG